MSTFYVVHKGRNPGIYSNWNDCKKQVDKFENPIFKKFNSKEEAQLFLKNGFGENKKPPKVVKKENADKKNSDLVIKEVDPNSLVIYTDGSHIKSKNNSSIAGYGIYIPCKNIKVSAPLINQKLTNNRAELTAIIESIKYLDEIELGKKICIFTDSQYSKYIFDGTGERYEKNNFRSDKGEDVPNIDLIKKMLEIKRSYNIVLLKVRAHTEKKDEHSMGNAMADKLANDGALLNQKKNDSTLTFPEMFEFGETENLDLTNQSMMNEIHTKLNKKNYFTKDTPKIGSVDKLGNSKTISVDKLVNTKLSQWFSKINI